MFSFRFAKAPSHEGHSDEAGIEFCFALIRQAQETFGSFRIRDILQSAFSARGRALHFGGDNLPALEENDSETRKTIIIVLVNEFTKAFGTAHTEALLEAVIKQLEMKFSPDGVRLAVIPLIPAGFLEHRKIRALSKEELEREVEQKTIALREINERLEQKVAERTKELQLLLDDQERAARLLVSRDFELTRANDRLRKLDDVKSNFISVVAHQLRTPLSGIKWTLNLLLNGDLGSMATEQKTFLLKAYESNDRMIGLVNDMLGADRIESGKMRYAFQPLQLEDVVDNVLFELLPQANAKDLKIRFGDRPKDLPKVSADPERIRAVFQNLLENSVKYSRQGGTIEIGMASSDHTVTVSIRDDGIGIPKEQQKYIFDRFFRAQNAIKLETEGSGLGLFIVKSIVERHGGKVWFESEENKGVTFHFTLPAIGAGEANKRLEQTPVDGL